MSGSEGIDSATNNGDIIPEFDAPRADYFDGIQTRWLGQKPVKETVEYIFEEPIYSD